jgi:hypothetical protein
MLIFDFLLSQPFLNRTPAVKGSTTNGDKLRALAELPPLSQCRALKMTEDRELKQFVSRQIVATDLSASSSGNG